MPVFPTKENEIYALSARMLKGFQDHPADFPRVSSAYLWTRRWQYRISRRVRLNAVSRLRLAIQDKNEKFKQLKSAMKDCLKQSRVDTKNDPKKMNLIGYSVKNGPSPLAPPNMPLNLRAISQTNGTVRLRWDKPIDGGPVENYLIERREQKPDVPTWWRLMEFGYDNKITLPNQPSGVTLEYRVIAANKRGMSLASNVVAVVL